MAAANDMNITENKHYPRRDKKKCYDENIWESRSSRKTAEVKHADKI